MEVVPTAKITDCFIFIHTGYSCVIFSCLLKISLDYCVNIFICILLNDYMTEDTF